MPDRVGGDDRVQQEINADQNDRNADCLPETFQEYRSQQGQEEQRDPPSGFASMAVSRDYERSAWQHQPRKASS